MKEVQVKVRLPESLREQLQTKTKAEDISVNKLLVDFIQRYVDGEAEPELIKPDKVEPQVEPQEEVTLSLFSDTDSETREKFDWTSKSMPWDD